MKKTERLEVITTIIDELFYDNISVQNISMSNNKEFKKQMQILSDCEKNLIKNLSGKNSDNFRKFSESWSYVNAESNREYFSFGFRIGALIILDIMNGKFTD